jgi:hypothetical protein
MKGRYRYGAHEKDGWWEDDGNEFVSPLQPNCETRFRFEMDGSIKPVRNHTGAITTIRVLRLDHQSLQDDRKRAIEEFIFGPSGDEPLSIAKTNRAMASICHRNANRYFFEFCVAIRDSLLLHLRNLTKLAERNKYSRKR